MELADVHVWPSLWESGSYVNFDFKEDFCLVSLTGTYLEVAEIVGNLASRRFRQQVWLLRVWNGETFCERLKCNLERTRSVRCGGTAVGTKLFAVFEVAAKTLNKALIFPRYQLCLLKTSPWRFNTLFLSSYHCYDSIGSTITKGFPSATKFIFTFVEESKVVRSHDSFVQPRIPLKRREYTFIGGVT